MTTESEQPQKRSFNKKTKTITKEEALTKDFMPLQAPIEGAAYLYRAIESYNTKKAKSQRVSSQTCMHTPMPFHYCIMEDYN